MSAKPAVVYDATVVAFSCGALTGRKKGNALDLRLAAIERFVFGFAVARYNRKLFSEYDDHTRTREKNDVVRVFLELLVRNGVLVNSNRLSRTDYARALSVRWPSHDQHLLAAAICRGKAILYVTEAAHSKVASGVKRAFGIDVIGL